MAFEYIQEQRHHSLCGQPILLLSQSEVMLPDAQEEPLVFQWCPVPGQHRKEAVSVLFAPSLQVFMYIDEIPLTLPFFRLHYPSSPSLSSYERCSGPLTIFVALLLDSLQ